MKRTLILLTLLGLVVCLLAFTGCGDDKTTIEGPGGESEPAEEDGGEVTYRTEEGDVTYDFSDKPPSETDLGAPIYPGAEYVPGSGGTATTAGPEGGLTTSGAEFTTRDSFADVLGFYADELGEPLYQDSTTKEASWMLDLGAESFTVVAISDEGDHIMITIGRMAGSMGQ